jgi:hypothetical protein
MRFRWTIKQLEESTDNQIIRGILTERINDLNPYTPLAKRLHAIRAKLEAEAEPVPAPEITHTPELDGMRRDLASFRVDGWDEEDLAYIALKGTAGYMDTPDAEIRDLYALYFGGKE